MERKFAGLNGSILVKDDNLYLIREKKLDGVFHELGTITIPINQIKQVAFAEAGLTNGFIAILRKGDRRPRTVFSAIKNETAVIFRVTKNAQAHDMVRYVESLM